MTLRNFQDHVAHKNGWDDWDAITIAAVNTREMLFAEAAELYARSKCERLETALNEIRGHTYARDTDDAILHDIKGTLTEYGFPYESED